MKVGIIGGSGFYHLEGFEHRQSMTVSTVYGEPSSAYELYTRGDTNYYFLARHGNQHTLAPHNINYRANIDGFSKLGVEKILSFSSVGSINTSYNIGDFIITDNAIDFTFSRNSTFFDEEEVYHIDFTYPFCNDLRTRVIEALRKIDTKCHIKGTYICTNGPRFETASEIKMFSLFGADIVGMTLFPECVLAREKQICYANVGIVANCAAGICDKQLTPGDIADVMDMANRKIKDLLHTLSYRGEEKKCNCRNTLDNAKSSRK